jgi:hypothetical protein
MNFLKNMIMKSISKESWRFLLITLSVLLLLFIGQFSPVSLFRASLLDETPNDIPDAHLFFSKEITAHEADEGFVSVRVGKDLPLLSVVNFRVQYNSAHLSFFDTYELGNLQDAQGNKVIPEMRMIEPKNQEGYTEVSLVSLTPFTVKKGDILIKLNAKILAKTHTKIDLSFSHIEAIDASYQSQVLETSSGKISVLAIVPNLEIENTTLEENTLCVAFNDYLENAGSLSIKNGETDITENFDSPYISGKSVCVDLKDDNSFPQDSLLTVYAQKVQGNIKTLLSSDHSVSLIATPTEKTNLFGMQFSKVLSKSSVELIISGSSLANPDLKNPTKYQIRNRKGIDLMKPSSATLSGNNLILNFPQPFAEDEKYFLYSHDTNLFGQNRVIFFEVPKTEEVRITGFSPSSVSAGETITIQGSGLLSVKEVFIDTLSVSVSSRSSTAISFLVPKTMSSGLHTVKCITNTDTLIIKEDAFSVIQEDQKPVEIIETSASPSRVLNNGSMKTRIEVFITASSGLQDITDVNIDLRPIKGSARNRMIGESQEGTFDDFNNTRMFSLETVVSPLTQTSETPLSLPVTVTTPQGKSDASAVSLIVTNNIITSTPPEILSASATPSPIMQGDTVNFYVEIKDLDGISTLDTVRLDLTSLGLGPRLLSPLQEEKSSLSLENTENTFLPTVSGTLRTQGVFTLEGIVLPKTTKKGNYTLPLRVSDKTGSSVTSSITMSIQQGNAPKIDDERSYITPRTRVPNNGTEEFSFTTYVSDEDGIDDITQVVLDIQKIGGTTVELSLQGEKREGQKGGFYSVSGLTVAKETGIGTAEIPLYVYDTQGNETDYTFKVEVTAYDTVGKAPQVNTGKSYTSPAVVPADETTKMSLNIFIDTNEFPVTQVIADLQNIGKYTGSSLHDSCEGATNQMVCLTPGIKEGDRGQWFTISDIVINKTTKSSTEPYRIRVTATDEKGKMGEGFLPLLVGDGTLPTSLSGYPKMRMAISTDPDTIEVLFSHPIDKSKLQAGAFTVVSSLNTRDTLAVTNQVVNAEGTVVTLTTNEQEAGKRYTVIGNTRVLGIQELQYTDNHAECIGYDKQEIPPQLIRVKPLSSTLLELIFSEGLKPSSIRSVSRDFEIFTRESQPKTLAISHIEFGEDNNTLRISTEKQIPKQEYTLRIKNILSASGVPVGGKDRTTSVSSNLYFGIHKIFTGYGALSQDVQTLFEKVDFDKNGVVDFTDFTIFASMYGKNLEEKGESDSSSSSSYSPSALTDLLPVPVSPQQ